MSARLSSLSPRVIVGIAVGVVLLYAVVAWLLVVSPKRAEAVTLGDDIAAAETRLAAAEAAAARPQTPPVSIADVLKLSKAMPASRDQAGLVLELSSLAAKSGITLRSITPETAVAVAGAPTAIPVTITVTGAYFKIARFLTLTRALVTVRGDEITARGRLFAIQNVELRESQARGFPQLDGTITLRAYAYDGPITPPAAPVTPGDDTEPVGTAAAGSTS
ncbi:MAG: type 4a pilus biogenesis protein PilO [Gaiellaceae bacterium]